MLFSCTRHWWLTNIARKMFFFKIEFDWLTLNLLKKPQKWFFSCAFSPSFVQLELAGLVEIVCEPDLIWSTMVDNAFPQWLKILASDFNSGSQRVTKGNILAKSDQNLYQWLYKWTCPESSAHINAILLVPALRLTPQLYRKSGKTCSRDLIFALASRGLTPPSIPPSRGGTPPSGTPRKHFLVPNARPKPAIFYTHIL